MAMRVETTTSPGLGSPLIKLQRGGRPSYLGYSLLVCSEYRGVTLSAHQKAENDSDDLTGDASLCHYRATGSGQTVVCDG